MGKTVETTLKLPVKLTSEEKNQRAEEMANAIEDAEKLREEKRRQRAEINEDIKEKVGVIRNLARVIASGEEERTVNCEEQWNFATREVTVVRKDTGEVLEDLTRKISDEERQESLIKEERASRSKEVVAKSKQRKQRSGDPLDGMEGDAPKKDGKNGDPLGEMETNNHPNAG